MTESTSNGKTGRVKAAAVEFNRSAAREVTAETVDSKNSALGFVRADTVRVNTSAVGASIGSSTHLRNSYTVATGGGHVRVENSMVQWLIGGYVEAHKVFSLAVIGGAVHGEVRALMTARAAMAFGIALGLSGLAPFTARGMHSSFGSTMGSRSIVILRLARRLRSLRDSVLGGSIGR